MNNLELVARLKVCMKAESKLCIYNIMVHERRKRQKVLEKAFSSKSLCTRIIA
jgi:hypothetical protein